MPEKETHPITISVGEPIGLSTMTHDKIADGRFLFSGHGHVRRHTYSCLSAEITNR